jgi:hypothetical protein
MGQSQTIIKCNFEDVQNILNNKDTILINTLRENEQDCLILGTISLHSEIQTINNALQTNKNIKIFIYGKNSNDNTIYEKYKQLMDLGFPNIFLYVGGIFEWLCLQDIYGDDEFPTTKKELDILKYKPNSMIHNNLLLE